MAVIQMGAIVTKIKGSVGGTAFKTQRATQVMFNKSKGYSKSKSYQNPAINYARSIFQKWSFLTAGQKLAWNNQAAILFFLDKFGNSVHITGRQLYTKVNLNLRQLDYLPEPPLGFDPLVSLLSNEPCEASMSSEYAFVPVEVENIGDSYVSLSLEVSLSPLREPVFVSRKVIKTITTSSNTTINFFDEMMEQFPYINASYNIRVYLEIMNEYGFKGAFISTPLNWLP